MNRTFTIDYSDDTAKVYLKSSNGNKCVYESKYKKVFMRATSMPSASMPSASMPSASLSKPSLSKPSLSKSSRIRGRANTISRASSRMQSWSPSRSQSRSPSRAQSPIQHALFNISARNYVFVGDFIYTFESPTITYFKTFRTADSRSWSYAVSKHRVYLLNYGVVLNDPPFDPFDSDFNPYVYYDAIALINAEPVFVGIAPHYIYYTPNPEFDFEYICGSTYMLRRRHDPQTAITINDYCEMMREFERTYGVEKLNYTPLYC